ncbi:fungal-specific transcription factor domain-containing protein [Bisporella sp. PMI_857]|nr:fungal-specific transcription factor domain-containing protein [Bisporella sp. PMI_857]
MPSSCLSHNVAFEPGWTITTLASQTRDVTLSSPADTASAAILGAQGSPGAGETGRATFAESARRHVSLPRRPHVRTNRRSGTHILTETGLFLLGATLSGSENIRQRSEIVHHGLVHQSAPFGADPVVASGVNIPPQDPSAKVVHELEDVPGRTAHYMGLAAEQDPYFLDAFRSVLVSDREGVDARFIQVYQGGPVPDDYPIHFLLLTNEFPQYEDQAKRAAAEAIENIVSPYAKEDIPASLRGAVYVLACVFWQRDASLADPCPFQQHELITHAQESLRRELEAPNLCKLQACILLMHIVLPEMDSVETPHTWIMAAQTTACAQMVGLHQDPTKWNIATWEKKLRKKLWWASYLTDCWSAVCHGNPPHIGHDSFNTPPLSLDDLRSDEDIHEDLHYLLDPRDTSFRASDGARFLEMVNVSQDLRVILDCSCHVKATAQTRTRLVAVREKMAEWPSLIPACLTIGLDKHNSPLHLSFYATQALLFRGLMYPATIAAKTTSGSNLRRWLSTALVEFQPFTTFMDCITEEEFANFWGRHARCQFIICGNFLIYLFLLATDPCDVEAAYRLLEKLQQSCQRLANTNNPAARLLLRPIMLRIDSFFTQAAELIKNGRSTVVESPGIGL